MCTFSEFMLIKSAYTGDIGKCRHIIEMGLEHDGFNHRETLWEKFYVLG